MSTTSRTHWASGLHSSYFVVVQSESLSSLDEESYYQPQKCHINTQTYCSDEINPVKSTNAPKSDQSTEISLLKLQKLVQSEKVILSNLHHHQFGFAIQSFKNLNAIQISSKIETLHVAETKVLKKTSCLYKLDPFFDGGGRLQLVDVSTMQP